MTQPQKPQDDSAAPPQTESWGGWGWTRRQRLGLAILSAILLAALIIQYLRRPARLDDPLVILHGQSVTLPQKIDPNTASLHELARIPHIGDILAQKIIDYRQARQPTAAGGIVFRQPSDLDPIPGIGQKLINQLSPFLQFPQDTPETQP